MIHLFEAVQLLVKGGVEFVIVGGVALRSHGSAYLTQDLDVCYSRRAANLARIADVLRPFNPRPRGLPDDLPFVWDASTLRNGANFTLQTTLCDIDLLAEVPGIGTFDDVFAESLLIDLDGYPVRILSIEALIKAKETAGRPKDQAGLRELYALREATVNDDE